MQRTCCIICRPSTLCCVDDRGVDCGCGYWSGGGGGGWNGSGNLLGKQGKQIIVEALLSP